MRLTGFARLAMLPTSMMLMGCQLTGSAVSLPPSLTIEDACLAFPPIMWSLEDTEDTAAAVREHNRGWVALCEPEHEDGGT